MMAVTQGLGDGYALYNGVKLPNIDKVWTDKETYPYAYIIDNLKNDEYLLILSSQESHVDFTNSLMTGSGAGRVYKHTDGSDSYSLFQSSNSLGKSYSKSKYSFVWANHDILKDSTVYYSATDPIPLDGMQVIEWDGDTTGLENLYEMQYKVSDTILRKDDFTNCVVVMTYADRIAVGQGVEGLESEGIAMSEVDGVMSIYSEDNQYGISTGLWFGKTDGVAYTSLFAYTAAEPEQPKWTFNLLDFLSGIASAAASRGVLRRTNGVQIPNDSKGTALISVGAPITDPLSYTMGYNWMKAMLAQRKRKPIGYLYNGVRLPKLPEWDKEKYPYAMIVTSSSLIGNYAYFYAFNTQHHRNVEYNDSYYFSIEEGETYVSATIYRPNSDDFTGYTFNPKVITSSNFSVFSTYATWANYNVMDENGETLLMASVPVPVYE